MAAASAAGPDSASAMAAAAASAPGEVVKLQSLARGFLAKKEVEKKKAAAAAATANATATETGATAAGATAAMPSASSTAASGPAPAAATVSTADASAPSSTGSDVAAAAPSSVALPKQSPFVPSDESAIRTFVSVASLTVNDTVLDVGCGDARVLIRAAQLSGCSGVGVECDPKFVARARAAVATALAAATGAAAPDVPADAAPAVRVAASANASVGGRLTRADQLRVVECSLHSSALHAYLQQCTVVWLFLLPEVLAWLAPVLVARLRVGTRVCSYTFELKRWPLPPDAVHPSRPNGLTHLFLYTVTQQAKDLAAAAAAAVAANDAGSVSASATTVGSGATATTSSSSPAAAAK